MLTRPPIRLGPDTLTELTEDRVDKVVEEPNHLVQEVGRLVGRSSVRRRPVDLGELEKVV
jgi:hypothetical protein